MKKSIFFALLASLVGVSGCKSKEEIKAINDFSSKNPEFVAKTAKGDLFRITLLYEQGHEHYVYFFETNSTVSVNWPERAGKTYINRVIVVDGVSYKEIKWI